MKIAPAELNRRMSLFGEELKRSGVKITHQRIEIFREVAGSAGHPDADTVYRGVRGRVPTVSLDTVYRTLWLLLNHGLITVLGPSRERTRFDANMMSHHHFVCDRCGLTRDFYSQELDEITIPKSVKSFGHVEKAQVEVRGVCFACANNKTSVPKTWRTKGVES